MNRINGVWTIDKEKICNIIRETLDDPYSIAVDESEDFYKELASVEDVVIEIDNLLAQKDGSVETKLEVYTNFASDELPKVSILGLPSGVKFNAKTMGISGKVAKPGDYSFTVKAEYVKVKKTVTKTFLLKVPNLTTDMFISAGLDSDEVYDLWLGRPPEISAVVAEIIRKGWKLSISGLPPGITFDVKNGILKGIATKEGQYTVYFTATKGNEKEIATATFEVSFPELWIDVDEWYDYDDGWDDYEEWGEGTVKGEGRYQPGKKVSLKATPSKGCVFVGWYDDGYWGDDWGLISKDMAYSYVMPDEDIFLTAVFATAEQDKRSLKVNLEDKATAADGTFTYNLGECVESLSQPKLAVLGLPAGLKYDTKTNTITGKAKKPGVYTVTVKLTNTTVKKAIEKKFTIEVPNLIAANGYFIDYLYNDVGEKYMLSVGITNIDEFLPSLKLNSATAKLAVSGLPSGLKYDAKTGRITGIATKPGTYTVTLTVTDGKAKYISTITVEVESLPEFLVGTYTGLIGRDVYVEEDDPWMAYGMANVTVAANGKITAKMTLPCGAYSFSAAGWDSVEDGVYSAVMRTKNGEKFELVIDSGRNWMEGTKDSRLWIHGYEEFQVPLWRNEHGKDGNIEFDPYEIVSDIKALKKVAFRIVGSKEDGYQAMPIEIGDRSANMTISFDTRGGVKYAGNFDGVRVNGSTFLCVDSGYGYYRNVICNIAMPIGKTEAIYIACNIHLVMNFELWCGLKVLRADFEF